MFFDEVALMPESFVNQATGRRPWTARSSVQLQSRQSRALVQDWLDRQARGQTSAISAFHDGHNLSLTEAVKERYWGMYTGVFFKRHILGEWKSADGVISPPVRRRPGALHSGRGPGGYHHRNDGA